MFVAAAGMVTTAVRNRLRSLSRVSGKQTGADRFRTAETRVFPATSTDAHDGEESLDVWGFRDTRFKLDPDGTVELTGNRYALCGHKLPALLPWVQQAMQIEIPPDEINKPAYPPKIPKPIDNAAFAQALGAFLKSDQITQDAELRLRHGHGHTQEEMYAIKYGSVPRVPDMVVFPREESEVVQLVAAASEHNVCLIPFGGGTNVTEALRCPEDEQRTIVSVDMKHMNRVLWLDPINRMACIEAGAVGRHIMATLAERGYTMGHEPDSVEFSTLGGWVATHASGMKKNKYGNIEDLVLDLNVVTPDGMLKRSSVAPRESVGSDPRNWMFGSEGSLGIITCAVVKLFPLPEAQTYGSVMFPSLEDGVAFLYELTQAGAQPASVRLVDNLQFQLSMALKPASQGMRALKSQVEKLLVTKLKGFDPQRMVACTLVFEGTAQEVEQQETTLYRIAAQHGGLKGGAENGKRGYQLTYGIAYIRDFIMTHYILAESFETSVPWSRVLELCERVKRRVHEEHAARNLPGKPFVTCRVTQVYDTGVAVYFYFAYYYKGVPNPSEIYAEIEAAARDEILRCGGSLSHHHGVGKLRKKFLPEIMSPAALAWNQHAKQAVDPQNVFGCGNLLQR
jgi:alkyldihydroxyacetonephosphate synthase